MKFNMSTWVTEIIKCDDCYRRLGRKLNKKEKYFYSANPLKIEHKVDSQFLFGAFKEEQDYEDILSILIKSVICHPVRVAIMDSNGIKEMIIQPLEDANERFKKS